VTARSSSGWRRLGRMTTFSWRQVECRAAPEQRF
jgi:hypothetical protein